MAPANTNLALVFIFLAVFCIAIAVGGYKLLQHAVRFPP